MRQLNLESYSEDVQEIMSTPPSWVASWGTLTIILALILLGSVGYYFEYPEKVEGKLVLSTPNPPIPINSPHPGRIFEVLLSNEEDVKTGQVVAILENSAKYEDILKLEKEVMELERFEESTYQTYEPNEFLDLGEVEDDYAAFLKSFNEFSFVKSAKYDKASVRSIERAINAKKKEIESFENKKKNAEKDLDLANKNFNEAQEDFYDSDSSEISFKYDKLTNAKEEIYKKEDDVYDIENNVSDKYSDIAELNSQMINIKYSAREGTNSQFQELKRSLGQLKTAIDDWKSKYLITSPIRGSIMYYKESPLNKYYKQGGEVMAVVPIQDKLNYLGKVEVSINGAGKVEEGQEVLIKFDRFPFDEYGMVKGKVSSITSVPENDKVYLVNVIVEKEMKTNRNKKLPFRQLMTGEAEIITDNKRFISRLFDKVRE